VRGSIRTWLPFVIAALALAGTQLAGPILTWVLLFVVMVSLLDGVTLLWSRSGTSMGGHRQ
jgi:hypothetical protein